MQNNGEFVGTPNELFPIIEHEGVHVVDSRLIAEALGIEHRALLQTIKSHGSPKIYTGST
jgi:phage regulator Rha-like protein